MNSQHRHSEPTRQRSRVFPTLVSATLLAALAWSGSLARCAEPQPGDTLALDARHVKTKVPAKLVADQVFDAAITMKNVGSQAWGDGLKLRSCEPVDNRHWGSGPAEEHP